MGKRRAAVVRAWSACGAAVALALAGCSSPMRTQYVKLHSIASEPTTAPPNDEVAAAFGLDDYAEPSSTVVVVEPEE